MMIKKILTAGVGMLCAVMMLTGCAADSFDHLPPMTDAQQAVIAEFAVGTIISRSSANRRLATVAEITAFDEREALRNKALGRTQTVEEKPPVMDPDIPGEEAVTDTQPAQPDVQTQPAAPFEGIAAYCGADGFQIDYMGHHVTNSYPDQSSGVDAASMYFTMDAAPGTSLLVLSFDVVNVTQEERELNMMDAGVKYRISVDGLDTKGILTTLLLDDLSSYVGKIPAGEVRQLVLIREIPSGTDVRGIGLLLRSDRGDVQARLE